jgi:hypothetical protein
LVASFLYPRRKGCVGMSQADKNTIHGKIRECSQGSSTGTCTTSQPLSGSMTLTRAICSLYLWIILTITKDREGLAFDTANEPNF